MILILSSNQSAIPFFLVESTAYMQTYRNEKDEIMYKVTNRPSELLCVVITWGSYHAALLSLPKSNQREQIT